MSAKVFRSRSLELDFNELIANVGDLRPVFKKIVKVRLDIQRKEFANDGKRKGRRKGWAPLKKSTISDKIRLAHRHKIKGANIRRPLVRTGRLRKSLTELGSPDMKIIMTTHKLRHHTTLKRAFILDKGDRKNNLKGRQMARITARDRNDLTRIMIAHLSKDKRGKFIAVKGRGRGGMRFERSAME